MGGLSRGGIEWSARDAVSTGTTGLSQTKAAMADTAGGPSASVWAHLARQPATSGHAVFFGQCGQGLEAGLWHGGTAWALTDATAPPGWTSAIAATGATSNAASMASEPSNAISSFCALYAIIAVCHRRRRRASYNPVSAERATS